MLTLRRPSTTRRCQSSVVLTGVKETDFHRIELQMRIVVELSSRAMPIGATISFRRQASARLAAGGLLARTEC